MTQNEISKTSIEMSRSIPASPEAVFDAWLDAGNPGSPFHGVAKAILNPVVDGLFYTMYLNEGMENAHYGRFVELRRAKAIEMTWVSAQTQGWESRLRIELEAKGSETSLKLVHSNLPNDAGGKRHEVAWNFLLSAMNKRFSKPE